MRVAVTGASGFIGAQLTQFLRKSAVHVTEIDLPKADILDTRGLTELLDKARPDQVYHLAAQASVRKSWDDPLDTWRTNVLGTVSLFEAIRSRCPAAKTLIMSSASVFDGATVDGRIAETLEPRPRSPYGASKRGSEIAAQNYIVAHDLQLVVVRPFNVIGPTQSSTYVVPALARRLLDAKDSGDTSIPVGNPGVMRDFVDVQDAVRALRLLMEHGRPGATYNLCTGAGVSIDTVVRTLASLSGARLTYRKDEGMSRAADAPLLVGDPTRTRAETGWAAETPLEDTLSRVLAATRLSRRRTPE